MSIDCKCLHCLNLAMGDEITKLRRERDEARRLAGEAKQQLDRDLGFSMHDWACVECWPESESLIDGFRCARHAIPTEWVPAKGGKP